MATASTTTTRRRRNGNGGNVNQAAQWTRSVGLESTHDAQEALGRTMRATVETMTTLGEVGQRVNRELAEFMLSGSKESLKLWADMQGTWLEAMQTAMGGFSTSGPAIEAWQKVIEGNSRAFGRYAEVLQDTAEKGTDRIKEAVEVMADQVKDAGGQLASVAEVIENDRATLSGRSSRNS
jgi:hypothetical protein